MINESKPNTGVPQTELNVGSGWALLVGGSYYLVIGAQNLTAGMENIDGPTTGDTWATIQPTWLAEIDTWLSASRLVSNQQYQWFQESIYGGAADEWVTYTAFPTTVQSFTANGGTISSVEFYLKRIGSPTGNVYAVVYDHTGTYGTTSKPTGSPIATSDPIDITTLGADYEYTTFTFSGAERIALTPGEHYCIGYTYDVGSALNALGTVLNSWGSHDGNAAEIQTGVWSTYSVFDLPFRLRYSTEFTNVSKP